MLQGKRRELQNRGVDDRSTRRAVELRPRARVFATQSRESCLEGPDVDRLNLHLGQIKAIVRVTAGHLLGVCEGVSWGGNHALDMEKISARGMGLTVSPRPIMRARWPTHACET